MKKLFVFGFWALSIVIIAGCGPAIQGVPSAAGMHAEGNFDGCYHSPAYGRMELTVDGAQVHGLYEGERHYGRIEGTINGDLLQFSWTQWKEDLNGKVRKKTGKGYFKYIVREEGTTKKRLVHFLEGEWGYGETYTGNPWKSVKLPAKAKKILQPRDNEGPTGVMDNEYAESAGFGVADQPDGEVESVQMSEPKKEEEEEDDGIDGLF